MTPVPSATIPPRRRPLVKRPWFWALMSLIGLVIVFGVMFVAAVPLSSDTLRHRIVSYLSDKLDSDVELGDLHFRAFPRLRVEGADLRIRKRGLSDYPPLISIRSFHVDASIVGLYRKHVDHVRVDGLDINIAPSQARDKIKLEEKSEKVEGRAEAPSGGPAPTAAEPRRDPLTDAGIVIDAMDTIDARLLILPFEKDKQPKVWAIHKLHMRELGSTRPWPFEATLTNGVPPGEIDVNGTFGPWHRDEPGDTPLEGTFMFAKADLGVFKGIAGTLSSHGYFGGTLAELEANGETDTPDFTLAVGGHPFPLYATYQARIDGTNGDTRLQNIDAWFLNSLPAREGRRPRRTQGPARTHGDARRRDGQVAHRGHHEDGGEDALAADGRRAEAEHEVPPAARRERRRRSAAPGRPVLDQRRRASPTIDVQGKIEELSKRGRGKTAEPAKERVASEFPGTVQAGPTATCCCPMSRSTCPARASSWRAATALQGGDDRFQGTAAARRQDLADHDRVASRCCSRWSTRCSRRRTAPAAPSPSRSAASRSAPDFGLDVRRVFKRGDPSVTTSCNPASHRDVSMIDCTMWIVRIALSRPYTFVVLALLILMVGPLTIARTPTDIFPNIDIPVVTVIWNYGGLSARGDGEAHRLDLRAHPDHDGRTTSSTSSRSRCAASPSSRSSSSPARTSTRRSRRSPRSRRRSCGSCRRARSRRSSSRTTRRACRSCSSRSRARGCRSSSCSTSASTSCAPQLATVQRRADPVSRTAASSRRSRSTSTRRRCRRKGLSPPDVVNAISAAEPDPAGRHGEDRRHRVRRRPQREPADDRRAERPADQDRRRRHRSTSATSRTCATASRRRPTSCASTASAPRC